MNTILKLNVMKIKRISCYDNKVVLILMLCVGFSFGSCSQPSLDEKQRKTMLKILDAIKVNDTITTAKLIDTANCFEIGGKENYYNSINKLFKKFSKNQVLTSVQESVFVITDEKSFGTTYKIILYTAIDKKRYYEIRMRFVGDIFDKVYYFNSYFHNKNPEILVPAHN